MLYFITFLLTTQLMLSAHVPGVNIFISCVINTNHATLLLQNLFRYFVYIRLFFIHFTYI